MKSPEMRPVGMRVVVLATLIAFTSSGIAGAQAPAPAAPANAAQPPAAPAAAGAAQSEKTFSQEELEQLLAPIALYPDELFAQVLMASTYPLDIVSAERWVKANPHLKDKALEDALQNQPWDPSVKSLAVFPQVLTMMSEKLDWTQKLGDAFLAQQEDLMKTAQALRSKAVAQGTLKDSKEQKVITEKTETTTIIKIEPSNPEVVYVPTYNPTVVYGAWPYPAYPPYSYYPPGYVAGAAFVGFTAGVIVGGALWGGCNWGHNDVNVNVNRYNNFNKTNISNGNWQHNADRRGAVPYKDKGVAQKYNRGPSANAQARDAYRGRSDAGMQQTRADAARGGRTGPSAGAMDSRGGAQGFDRGASGTRNSSAFDTGSRAQTRDYSSRGASSMNSARSSSGARASSGMSGGGARAGGGGAPRGGGGGRGGGRR
ncbi:MAG: DUF3300 domain-containing protein [Rudaea sp.]